MAEQSLTPVFRRLVSPGATINVYVGGDVCYFKDSDLMWTEQLPEGEVVRRAYREGESIIIETSGATHRFAEQRI